MHGLDNDHMTYTRPMTITIGDRTATLPAWDEISNAFYMLPVLFASGVSALMLLLSQSYLTAASWWFHDSHSVTSQRADELGVGWSIGTVACVVIASVTGLWWVALLSLAWAEVYRRTLHIIRIEWTVGAWAAIALGALAWGHGAYAALPAGLLGVALLLRLTNREQQGHGRVHGVWHLASAAAECAALWVV